MKCIKVNSSLNLRVKIGQVQVAEADKGQTKIQMQCTLPHTLC